MIFIDSDFIIDYLRNDKEAVNIINNQTEEIATTEINIFEVMFGICLRKNVSEKQISSANEFFSNLEVFPFDEDCGRKAAEILAGLIKEGREIDQNDCLIAAVILKNGFNKILTNNKKHFERIEELELV